MQNKHIRVVISGYFNPIHRGHVQMIKEARKLGNHLTVIVNTDKQVRQKGSVPFMNESDRAYILRAMKNVDKVVVSVDNDKTVRKTLTMLQPDIFANGGDRKNEEDIPEAEVCAKYGIQMIFNVGGKKVQSSSNLIRMAHNRIQNNGIKI